MKMIIGLALICSILIGATKSYAQNITCQEVFEIVTTDYDYKRSASCYGSTFLVKATYYELDDMGFVVAYIKKNEYDYYGSPYIFCGISSYRWSRFTSAGMYGSWG